ncbi:hypothetical protein OIU85_004966 [Salix viminalis]|uniref:Acyl carrier protein n=1 Tax=Salix viminalis TaxID=40686 RepID=A0A9Q0SYQ3_SALVM|nr:hypothetical protein OIU85_004966 [Salix viminalis]
MAASTGSLISMQSRPGMAASRVSGLKPVSLSHQGRNTLSFGLQSVPARRLRVSCAAKPETIDKFSTLGADSLDTVEIVMGLEEAFGISVEEESAQSIATVQDAADLIEKLVEKKD